jgi:anaerobic ribonucleoside-triphosphate reductase activating protein
MKIRIAGITKESVVDGPGVRYVIFSQGCKHNCYECHNPETHDFNGGYEIDADDIINDILNNKHIDGVTFSGGDPFYQIEGFVYIAKKLKENSIHIISYTGFTYEKIVINDNLSLLLSNIDVLIDGSFILEQKTLSLPFRGSKNQRIIDVQKSIIQGRIVKINF